MLQNDYGFSSKIKFSNQTVQFWYLRHPALSNNLLCNTFFSPTARHSTAQQNDNTVDGINWAATVTKDHKNISLILWMLNVFFLFSSSIFWFEEVGIVWMSPRSLQINRVFLRIWTRNVPLLTNCPVQVLSWTDLTWHGLTWADLSSDCYWRQGDGGTKTARYGFKTCFLR